MADVVYADGTLASGANNGTSWADAYQGSGGLQTAIDNHNGANATHLYIRNTFTLVTGIDIDKARTGYNLNKWLRIIGCDASGDVLPTGQYVNFDMNNDSGVSYGLKIDSTSWCTEVRNVRIHNGYTTKYGISLRGNTSTSRYNYILNNVKTEDVDYGIWAGNTYASNERIYNFIILNCHIEADIQAVKSNTDNWLLQHVENSVFKNNNGSYPVVSDARSGYGAWIGCIFIMGTYALHNSFAAGPVCYNCSFYGQATGVIYHQASAGKYLNINLSNCVFWSGAAAIPIITLASGGCVGKVEYNAGNNTHATRWGTNTPNPSNFTSLIGSPFIDGGHDDFRLPPDSPLLNVGLPGTAGVGVTGYSTIGAWQRKSMLGNE